MNLQHSTMSVTMFVGAFSLLLLMIGPEKADAKRGCSAFGHACFGGHGKRSNEHMEHAEKIPYYGSDMDNLNLNDIPQFQNFVHSIQTDFLKSPKKIDLSPFVKQWISSYRRAQLQHQMDYNDI